MDSSKFGNEEHFIYFGAIVASRNGKRARIKSRDSELLAIL
jgi:hypothetical protein